MKTSTKAALLSALVFPGVGHLYLKRYAQGVALAGISVFAAYYLVAKTLATASQIADKILAGEVAIDIQAITAMVEKQTAGPDAQLLYATTVAFIVCWLVGIIDSYRVGRLRDKVEEVLVDG